MAKYASVNFVRWSETDNCRVFSLDWTAGGETVPPIVPGQFDNVAAEIGAGKTAICICGGNGTLLPTGPFILQSDGVTVTAIPMGVA